MTATKKRPKRAPAPPADIPLLHKPALTYEEVEQLGFVARRQLQRLVAEGRVKKSVLRTGHRTVRFLREQLIEELKDLG